MGNRQSNRTHNENSPRNGASASSSRMNKSRVKHLKDQEVKEANIHERSFSSSMSDSLDFTHMFSMGQNDKGQLGRGIISRDDIENYPMGPVTEVEQKNTVNLDEDEQAEIASRVLKDIKFVATGRSHILMATHSNKLYGMGFNNYSQLGFSETEENIPRLREITLPEDIKSIDGLAAGWFHSVVVCDGNKVFCAGHSFFDQTFDVPMDKSFRRSVKMEFLQRDNSKITNVNASTFSSSLVVDNWKIFACGEMNANSNPANYLVPGCEIFKRDQVIKKFKHADKGLVVLTESGNVYFATKERPFHILMDSVQSITPSHMYETTYTMKDKSTILSECDLAPLTVRAQVNVQAFVEKYGMENIQLYCGYSFYYLVVNKRRVYTINGTELNEILNLDGVTTTVNIKEVVATSDCSYFIFERCLFTASELLMKSRLNSCEKYKDVSIVAFDKEYDDDSYSRRSSASSLVQDSSFCTV